MQNILKTRLIGISKLKKSYQLFSIPEMRHFITVNGLQAMPVYHRVKTDSPKYNMCTVINVV